MQKNSIIIFVVALIVVGAGSFYGGMSYGKNVSAAAAATRRAGRNGQFFQGGNFGGLGGQAVNGSILSKSESTLTVSLPNGGSKIILFSTSTPVRMSTAGSADQLVPGKLVVVNGTTNPDGSVTAQLIQIRDASSTFGGGSRPQP